MSKIIKIFSLFFFASLTILFSYCGSSSGTEDAGTSVCEEGASCKKSSDCNGGVCSGGKCKCKSVGFCTEDKECGTGMCCDTLKNQCYVCSKDAEESDVTEDVHQDVI
ncbi:MAG: hypothetical protein N3B13_08120, partial [Deltaproteobacteria bacterium]|nr:hypothetical protein [Deltaproteobacteria bacterium]